MNKSLRNMTLAAAAAALGLTATAAAAAPVSVSNGPVQAHAAIVKPLTLTKISDLDFGSIVVQDNGTAVMDTAGNLTCPATLTCGTTGTAAQYKVTGTNNQVVFITKPDVTLTNAANPGTPLTLVLSGPASVTLPNSGTTGTTFNLGGSMAISATTKDGTYVGDLNVTVNY
jgi:Mat/Ecp fimbriae major subunit